MLRDHPFSKRNKATKRAVKVEVGGEGVGFVQNLKKGAGEDRQYRGGVFLK